jgi:hypothetical protein
MFGAHGTKVECNDMQDGDVIYFVPYRRVFIWLTFEIGHITEVTHATSPSGIPITLETLSTTPRIFKVSNFFTSQESDYLIQHALSITDNEFKLKRSSTGTYGYNIDYSRTSENAFDTFSK